jgi:hypothetical protein
MEGMSFWDGFSKFFWCRRTAVTATASGSGARSTRLVHILYWSGMGAHLVSNVRFDILKLLSYERVSAIRLICMKEPTIIDKISERNQIGSTVTGRRRRRRAGRHRRQFHSFRSSRISWGWRFVWNLEPVDGRFPSYESLLVGSPSPTRSRSLCASWHYALVVSPSQIT